MKQILDQSFHDKTFKYDGIYRARVVEVDIEEEGEKNKYGAIRVFIPDLMNSEIFEDVDEFKDGILVYPGNMQMAGYNEDDPDKGSYYAAAGVMVPLKNSYVRVMFEGGDLERGIYIGPWHDKIAPLPIVNRSAKEPHKVYTIIHANSGRSVIVSDSEDNARVEITGKKRKLKDDDGPAGNKASVFEIEDNQSVIIIDESEGSEKILIQTHKGDFINLDVEKQSLEMNFKGDIKIKTDGKFQVSAKGGIDMSTNGSAALQSRGSMNMKSTTSSLSVEGRSIVTVKSTAIVAVKGAASFVQSIPGCPAKAAEEAAPEGGRSSGFTAGQTTVTQTAGATGNGQINLGGPQ